MRRLSLFFLNIGLTAFCLSGFLLAGAAETLEGLIEKANDAANRQDFPVAVQLYEQAVQKAPGEKVLKNNLAVLYANYGVSLQEQKKYDAALPYFEKALALLDPAAPQTKNVLDAKAATYFTQAMDLRDSKPTLAADDYDRIKDLLNKAIAVTPEQLMFKKAMASIYLDEAYQLAVQEQYTQAAPLLETAMTYDSQNKSVRQSLANVYLGLAKNEPEQRQAWIDKALAIDSSPKIKQTADQLLANTGAVVAGGFAATPDEARNAAPRELSKLSVAEMLNDMEAQLKLMPPKGATLLERLETIEKQVLGKKQDGALATRAKDAYTALMGSMNGSLADSNPNLVQAPVLASENSYLDEIFKMTDGKVIRWGKFPLRVHVEAPKDNLLYKPEYKEAVLHGLNAWKVKTNGFANYVEVENPDAADVQISFQDEYVDRFADPEKTPGVYKNYTPPKSNPLMRVLSVASMFAPGYFSLAPQAVNAAMQYRQYRKLEVIRDESHIKLGLAPTRDLPPDAAKLLIQNMAAKEFGHALGLKGNSSKQGDLLYPELRSDMAQLPSNRDLETLRALYNRPPNIILNVR